MTTKPTFGRSSEQRTDPIGQSPEPAPSERDEVDLGSVVQVFAIFGILGLVTSLIFLSESEVMFDRSVKVDPVKPAPQAIPGQPNALNQTSQETEQPVKLDTTDPDLKYPVRDYAELGPFRIGRGGIVLTVDIKAPLPDQSWTFVEAELLDDDKDYIFSFGNELWRESGRDSDGPWSETDDSLSMKLTIPDPGQYYLNIKTQGTVTPESLHVRVVRRLGSSIPHFAFGVLALLIAFVLNEIKNRTTIRAIARMSNR